MTTAQANRLKQLTRLRSDTEMLNELNEQGLISDAAVAAGVDAVDEADASDAIAYLEGLL